MKTSAMLWIAGWAGLAAGAMLAFIGAMSADELSQFAGGYGLMTMGAATYLLGGLGMRESIARRRTRPTTVGRQPLSTAGATNRP